MPTDNLLKYKILKTGFFFADGGAMFGAIPKRAWSRKYPSDEQNRCCLAMNCLLVWNDDRVILLDAGVGNKELNKLSYYGFKDRKDLRELIGLEGFNPEQITDVVLSHLHFDHCGGCTYRDEAGNLQITFPNARHWVGKKQWQNYLHPNALEKDAYRPEDMMPVFDAGLICRIDSDFELCAGFRMKLFDGHTKDQIVSFIKTEDGQQALFPGDVIPTKAHLSDEWISAYDVEPLQSLSSKIILKEWKKQKKVTIIFYHDLYHLSS
jgi:glyoxylase-like metal-dependent hydrolase (beta-lactamase superfamily II)